VETDKLVEALMLLLLLLLLTQRCCRTVGDADEL